MYKIVPWSESLDLTYFYDQARYRGFVNNQSQKVMVDCFRSEKEWAVWILYENDLPIGSVAAHTFNEVMGENTFRILTRVCTFAEARPSNGLITPKRLIAEHQNLTDQFLLPTCINWVNNRGRMFATSNASKEASQRLVHSHYFPTLAKIGIVEKIKDVTYRNTYQTVWEIFPDKFLENLNKYPRWK
jgi:hypothetical protein